MPTTLIVPRHVGFILDGNRRFAKLKGLVPWRGHEYGLDTVQRLLDWCEEFKIRELTLYTFSMQNFYRPSREVRKLMDLMEKEFTRMLNDPQLYDKKIRVRVIGQKELLPQPIQKIIATIEKATESHDQFTLNCCIAYGGKEEIVEAMKKIIKKVKNKVIDVADITLETVESHLLLTSQPDLIIRTGGEQRTSNFLAWQSAYSEWFFVPKLLPEFERSDFKKILRQYAKRERRFGQ